MKTIGPDYLKRFSCIAGQCRHSCCQGWEIDIDADTYARYVKIGGALGDRLRENIVPPQGGALAHFRLTADEKCPFLRRDGLCGLIVEKGEGILCQICRDHPRFRNYFTDRDEIGLGLCCEAAARLILTNREKPHLIVYEKDENEEAPSEDERALLAAREALIGLMQNRALPIEERLNALLQKCEIDFPRRSLPDWAAFFLGLERLDEDWASDLSRAAKLRVDSFPQGEAWETALEQLTVYLLYRHLPGVLNDGDFSGRVLFAVLCVRLLRRCFSAIAQQSGQAEMEAFIQLCRRFSAEIEYSDINVDAILEELAALRETQEEQSPLPLDEAGD